MGHVINPVSHRIGYTRFWNSNWSTSNFAALGFMNVENNLLLRYLRQGFIKLNKNLFYSGFILLSVKVARIFEKTIIVVSIFSNIINKIFSKIFEIHTNPTSSMFISNKSYYNENKKKLLKNENEFSSNKRSHLVHPLTKKLIYTTASRNLNSNLTSTIDISSHFWKNLNSTNSAIQSTYLKKDFYLINNIKIINFVRFIIINYWLSYIKSMFSLGLSKILKNSNFDIILVNTADRGLGASFIARYISTRLLRGYPIRQIFNNVIRQLKIAINCAWLSGFKIVCNGRFARRGRANHLWKLIGVVPKSSISKNVDYSIMLPVLTNSICSIKVWVTKPNFTQQLLII